MTQRVRKKWSRKIICRQNRLVMFDVVSRKLLFAFNLPTHDDVGSINQGDVFQLENGNFIIVTMNRGTAFEFSPTGQLLYTFPDLLEGTYSSTTFGNEYGARCVIELRNGDILFGFNHCMAKYNRKKELKIIQESAQCMITLHDGRVLTTSTLINIWSSDMSKKLESEDYARELRHVVEYQPHKIAASSGTAVILLDLCTKVRKTISVTSSISMLIGMSDHTFLVIHGSETSQYRDNEHVTTVSNIIDVVWEGSVIEYSPGKIVCQTNGSVAIIDLRTKSIEKQYLLKLLQNSDTMYLRTLVLEDL
jgi:hypothetical protein